MISFKNCRNLALIYSLMTLPYVLLTRRLIIKSWCLRRGNWRMDHTTMKLSKQKNQLKFKEILLELDRGSKSHCIDPNKFYSHLKQQMETCLLKREDICIPECTKVLFCWTWLDNPGITYGETEIKSLCSRFGLLDKQIVRGF